MRLASWQRGDVYSHVPEGPQEEAVAALNEVFA
jgi:hypothetical protein